VECLPCSVVCKDLDGRFTFANQKFCAEIGTPLEDFVGKTDFDFFPRELAEKYRRDDQAVIDSGQVLDIVEEHVTPKGKKFYVQVMKTPLFDPDGQPIGIQGIFWDVTERLRAEEELRHSRERFELAVQGSQDGLWDWDLATNRVWWSPRLRNMFGYDEHELSMWPDELERVHPDDHDRWRAALQGHIEGSADHFELEYRMLHKDGCYRWVRARGVALRDADGKAYRLAGSLEDITPRKQSEQELARERHLLHTLMDNLPDAIYFKDAGSRFIRVNKATMNLLGVDDSAQVVGKTHFDFFAEQNAERTAADDREIMRTGSPLVEEDEKITWPDGREGWLSTTKMPLCDQDGTTIGVFGVSRDISRRKQAEIALQESEHLYRSVIAAMHDGFLLLDADGRIRTCNESAQRILGLSAEDSRAGAPLQPRWCAIRDDGSPFPDGACPPLVTLRTGQPCSNVIMGVRTPEGSLSWLSVASQSLFRPDGITPAGVVACFTDVTGRRRTEETRAPAAPATSVPGVV
jgi:PAS domain S-box-containing protein